MTCYKYPRQALRRFTFLPHYIFFCTWHLLYTSSATFQEYRRIFTMRTMTFFLGFGFALALLFAIGDSGTVSIQELMNFSKENQTTISSIPRKLLALADDDGSTNRIGAACSKTSIDVFQGQTAPLPNGIPTYTVAVENICVSGSCTISNIHLSCGWFSSARLINPSIFRRISYDDCLVNNGQPVGPGETVSFQYANTFAYPLSVSSVTCN